MSCALSIYSTDSIRTHYAVCSLVFPDYLEVATAVVLSRGVGRTSLRTHVDMFHILLNCLNLE